MHHNGWYNHRGQWRKRGPITRRATMSDRRNRPDDPRPAEETGRLSQIPLRPGDGRPAADPGAENPGRAADGPPAAERDAEAFARLLAEGNYDGLALRFGADMAQNAVDALIDRITDDLYRAQTLRIKVARLQRELAGDDPSPIQRILAERVAVCYVDSYYSDILAQRRNTLSAGDFVQRRQDRAQRRYLQAVKALAECRKIEASTIQDTVVSRLKVTG
jgi:hypothetical protein